MPSEGYFGPIVLREDGFERRRQQFDLSIDGLECFNGDWYAVALIDSHPDSLQIRTMASINVTASWPPCFGLDKDVDSDEIPSTDSSVCYSIERAVNQTHGGFGSNQSVAVVPKQKPAPQLNHSASFVLDIPNTSEDSYIGQKLKRPLAANQFAEERKYQKTEDLYRGPKHAAGSTLMLESVSGPSGGLQYSPLSNNPSELPVTIGRVSPCVVVLKDSEVSGKHTMINWNINFSGSKIVIAQLSEKWRRSICSLIFILSG